MFASLIFVTQKEHPVAKPLTFKMRQTTHTADIPNQCCGKCNVGSLLTSVKLEAYYTKEIHNLFLGLSVFILPLIKASRKPQNKVSYFRKRHTGKCSRYVTGKLAARVSKHNL